MSGGPGRYRSSDPRILNALLNALPRDPHEPSGASQARPGKPDTEEVTGFNPCTTYQFIPRSEPLSSCIAGDATGAAAGLHLWAGRM